MSEPSFYILSEGQKNGFSSHDTSRSGFHHQDLRAFSEDVNNAAKRAFPNRGRSRYETVNVCLIRWEDDELGVQYELNALDHVLQDYGFRTDVFLIPSVNSHWDLMRKTLDFIQACDNDENLFVLYYAGHGRMNSARQAEWVFGQSPNSPFVDWSAIQGLFGTAKSDVLILLDTCAAASSATTSQFAVMETIAACGFERRAPPPGEHSLTNTLVDVLRDWINKPSFSAASLHTEILFRLKLKETKKGREGIPLEWCVTPVHWINTKDCKASGIELCRRNILPSQSVTPESEAHGEENSTTYIDPMDLDMDDSNSSSTPLSSVSSDGCYKVPHVLISLQLEENQSLDAKQCARWLDKFPLLAKWVKVEAVFPSYSTLMILSIPMPIWDMLPDHPACSFVGYITSPKLERLSMPENASPLKVPAINESSSRAVGENLIGGNSSVKSPLLSATVEQKSIKEKELDLQEHISQGVKDWLHSAEIHLPDGHTHQLNQTTLAPSQGQPVIANDDMIPSNPGRAVTAPSDKTLVTIMRSPQPSSSARIDDPLKKYSSSYKGLGETGQHDGSFLKFDSTSEIDLHRNKGLLGSANFTSHWTNERSLANGDIILSTKQRRISLSKVKTGCNNCKARKLKCDETRPQCTKCLRSGSQCDGYPAYKRTAEVAIPIASRLSSSAINVVPSATSSAPVTPKRPASVSGSKLNLSVTTTLGGIDLNSEEGRYFQLFRKHTSSELSEFFVSEFWTRSVLQETHSEASIRHAVVAMGALYKILDEIFELPPGSSNKSIGTTLNHYNFALRQYGKALDGLRKTLETQKTRSHRTILISIVLFTCFQCFIGDHKAAIFQIQHGLALLEEQRQNSKPELSGPEDDRIDDSLIQVFIRLAIQAKSLDMAFHFAHPYAIRLSPHQVNSTSPTSTSGATLEDALVDAHIPMSFTTAQEALQTLDSLCERIMRFNSFNEYLSSYPSSPNDAPEKYALSSGERFKEQLRSWSIAFQDLFSARRNSRVSNTERAGINVLKMTYLMTTILFFTSFSTTELEFDNYIPQFDEIVQLAKEIVVDQELLLAQKQCGGESECEHKANQSGEMVHSDHFLGLSSLRQERDIVESDDEFMHIKASFSLGLGIIPPLFVVATKCRDRKIRREAIRLLLSSPRREVIWDSILSGKVAQCVMEIEEEGLSAWEGPRGKSAAEVVSKEKRVVVKEVLFDLQKREATVKCGTRGVREGDPDARAIVKHISW